MGRAIFSHTRSGWAMNCHLRVRYDLHQGEAAVREDAPQRRSDGVLQASLRGLV